MLSCYHDRDIMLNFHSAFETEMKSSDGRGGGIPVLAGVARRASSSSACHSLDRPNRAGGRSAGPTNTTGEFISIFIQI